MELNFYEKLHGIDITIIILYLLFVVLLGLYFSSKHKDAEDYFLEGKKPHMVVNLIFTLCLKHVLQNIEQRHKS